MQSQTQQLFVVIVTIVVFLTACICKHSSYMFRCNHHHQEAYYL